jgi:hypothetical protein
LIEHPETASAERRQTIRLAVARRRPINPKRQPGTVIAASSPRGPQT